MASNKAKWADIPRGHDNPLAFALANRDKAVLDMVEDAIRHKQVKLAFQPVVSAGNTSRVAFYEGLIRVLDETGRIIPARDFIDAVETTEIGREIDCIALHAGLRALARQPDLRLSINMSARSIGYSRWMNTLKNGLKRGPTVGERLILEITEASALLVPELVADFMEELQQEGIAFALDDFGAGFTSLRYLKDFFFDIIKLDGFFSRGIAQDRESQVIAGALATMGRELDMYTVAENVERPEDAQVLAALGFDCLQGYLFGAPTLTPPWKQSGAQTQVA